MAENEHPDRINRSTKPTDFSTDNAQKLWLNKALPDLNDHVSDAGPADYVVLKMSPDNIRVMGGTDMKYSHVKLK